MNRFSLIEITLFFTFFTPSAFPMGTSADEISIDPKTNTYTLSGNAIAKDDGKVFKANTIIIKSENSKKTTRITANGNVSYQEGGTVIVSDLCKSDMSLIIFSGNVVIRNPKLGTIHADKIEYNIKTKNMDITSNKKVRLKFGKEAENNFNKRNKGDSRGKQHNKIF
ncbi:MAG: hypothetical protein LBI95_02195 [Holosporales bacterium]|jgi:lipopolysaccharide export system protein LptA|nr:hypothetical protein [Holosporales bacterium]